MTLSPYWGDPVYAHDPKGEDAYARVDTYHEGIWLTVPSSGAFFGPEEARKIAANLRKAADQWEED
jgi:hypothetical protein